LRAKLAPSLVLAVSCACRPAGAAEEPLLVLVPLGAPDEELIRFVGDALEKRFRFRVEIAEAQPMPREAFYAPRKRWRAEKILDALEALERPDAWRVAGLTEQPISTTKGEVYDWGIAGLGSLGGKTSVFTSHIFRAHRKKQRERYLREMKDLVVHEIGHTLGLPHCPLERCVMADAKGNAIRSADKSSGELCPACTKKIAQHLRDPNVHVEWSKEELAQLRKLGLW
jgi:archaemetzincin